jgi:hypothetical protein
MAVHSVSKTKESRSGIRIPKSLIKTSMSLVLSIFMLISDISKLKSSIPTPRPLSNDEMEKFGKGHVLARRCSVFSIVMETLYLDSSIAFRHMGHVLPPFSDHSLIHFLWNRWPHRRSLTPRVLRAGFKHIEHVSVSLVCTWQFAPFLHGLPCRVRDSQNDMLI